MKKSFNQIGIVFGMIVAFSFVGIFFYLLKQREPLAAAVSLGIATLMISILSHSNQK